MFTAYGFDLSASFLYSLGGKALDYGYMTLMQSPTSISERGNLSTDLRNAWTSENTTSTIPRFQYGDDNAAGYTFPGIWVRKLGLSSLRVYASCDNVYYWTKRHGFDPRSALDGQVRVQDDTSYSFERFQPIRSISGGITVKF